MLRGPELPDKTSEVHKWGLNAGITQTRESECLPRALLFQTWTTNTYRVIQSGQRSQKAIPASRDSKMYPTSL